MDKMQTTPYLIDKAISGKMDGVYEPMWPMLTKRKLEQQYCPFKPMTMET